MEWTISEEMSREWTTEFNNLVGLLPPESRAVIARQLDMSFSAGVSAGRLRVADALAALA